MNKIYKNKKELIADLIKKEDLVLDVGFWGQGVAYKDANWVHNLLKDKASEVFGVDLYFDFKYLDKPNNYFKQNAEEFELNKKFNVIFAGDLIEHLSNPGKFLGQCSKHLIDSGRLVITTPNAFNLFNIAGKFTNNEPVVNHDHTCYFNTKTITKLLAKNGWKVESVYFLYTLDVKYKESWKKKFLNIIYFLLSKFTSKFIETMIIVAKKI
jgi:2-polyprenyl-3-methyl-5-hydroxy-6-metoxy-1,4-benzoquinol methylase